MKLQMCLIERQPESYPFRERINHPHRNADSLLNRVWSFNKNSHPCGKVARHLNSFYRKLNLAVPSLELIENGKLKMKLEKVFSYRKYRKSDNFSDAQVLLFFKHAKEQGYAGTDAEFMHAFSKCSLYFKRHYAGRHDLLRIEEYKGKQHIGFQYVNPDGSKGGFLDIRCHVYSPSKSLTIDEASKVFGEAVFEEGVKVINSTIASSGRFRQCKIQHSLLRDTHVKFASVAHSSCHGCTVSRAKIHSCHAKFAFVLGKPNSTICIYGFEMKEGCITAQREQPHAYAHLLEKESQLRHLPLIVKNLTIRSGKENGYIPNCWQQFSFNMPSETGVIQSSP